MVEPMIKHGTLSDVETLASLYKKSFPETTRSRLGYETCRRYFEKVLSHDAYRLIIAVDSNKISGFAVLHVDLKRSIGKNWMIRSWWEIAEFAVREPLEVARLGIVLVRDLITVITDLGRNTLRDSIGKPAGQTGWIELIAVSGESRGKGLGEKLVSGCIDVAGKVGLEVLKLTVSSRNVKAIRLYEKIGFKRTWTSQNQELIIYTRHLNCKE